MAGSSLEAVQRLILVSATDDWVSDYEVQGDFQAELAVDPPVAFEHMLALVDDWIRRGILIPGDMLDGFVPWPGVAEERAARFGNRSAGLTAVTMPGQICWFDTGQNAPTELVRLEAR